LFAGQTSCLKGTGQGHGPIRPIDDYHQVSGSINHCSTLASINVFHALFVPFKDIFNDENFAFLLNALFA
jgi:hypothetical protein